MPTDLTIRHQTAGYTLNSKRLKKLTNWLLDQCGVQNFNVSLLLTDDREITQINAQYRGKNSPTNVLSFPFSAGADDSLDTLPINELGDIIISLDTALREAIEYKLTLHDRLSWLVIHGMLHLLGYDHERSARDARKMFDKENDLLHKLNIYRRSAMTKLAINVDHVATIRQARGINEPDPVTAAAICELAGAAGIVIHLREDRRHIQDEEVETLCRVADTRVNLEMAITEEMLAIAERNRPADASLVPEKREELTTEGGLDVVAHFDAVSDACAQLAEAGIRVSLFIDPDEDQLDAARRAGAPVVELHTGTYADAPASARAAELARIARASEYGAEVGLQVNAGHGLHYRNVGPIVAIPQLVELNIGHAIVARALFVGLAQAVLEMRTLLFRGDAPVPVAQVRSQAP